MKSIAAGLALLASAMNSLPALPLAFSGGGPSTWRHHRISPRRSTVAHAKRLARRRRNIRKHGG